MAPAPAFAAGAATEGAGFTSSLLRRISTPRGISGTRSDRPVTGPLPEKAVSPVRCFARSGGTAACGTGGAGWGATRGNPAGGDFSGCGATLGNAAGGDFAGGSARFGPAGETFAGRPARGTWGAIASRPDCRSYTMSAKVEVT